MKKVHFMGIGGSGASAAAAIAKAQGFKVTGCDKVIHNEFTKDFDPQILSQGHSSNHLASQTTSGSVNILAVSPAVLSLDPDNEELQKARQLGIEVLTWQEFMGKYLQKDKFVIAVCGTHGKSTTTAMIGLMMEEAGLDPTVELGAIVPSWGKNYRINSARRRLTEYFVTEADEFNNNFLSSTPDISVVTTIEMDHPEYFKNFEEYKESFRKFLGQTKQTLIANLSDKGVNEVLFSQGVPLSTQGDALYKIIDYSKELINFDLQVPGKFNKLNASAVFQVGLTLGIDHEIIKKSLQNYTGIGRRFEKIGEFEGAPVFSDFAHHPTEIKVTLEAAKKKFPDKKLVVIFQPHMFSRTKALFDDFVKVFRETKADQTFITDIYPSREVDTGLVSAQELVEVINKDSVTFVPKNKILEKLKHSLNPDCVIFFLGAGDINEIARDLLELSSKN